MAIFSPVTEKEVSLAIVEVFYEFLKEVIVSDVVIVGGGPAGLVASYYLAKAGKSVVVIEKNNAPGGGAWSGGYMMNQLTVRSPGDLVLKDFGIELKKFREGLFVGDALYICSKLISKAIESGVKILNLTYCEDIVLKDKTVKGVVINWSSIRFMPPAMRMLDPIILEAKAVVDATGHDASVVSFLQKRGLIKIAGEGAMHIEASEDLVVDKTGLVFPGLYVCGMAVSAVYGLPRMGPTFGAMYLSGKKLAEKILDDKI